MNYLGVHLTKVQDRNVKSIPSLECVAGFAEWQSGRSSSLSCLAASQGEVSEKNRREETKNKNMRQSQVINSNDSSGH